MHLRYNFWAMKMNKGLNVQFSFVKAVKFHLNVKCFRDLLNMITWIAINPIKVFITWKPKY